MRAIWLALACACTPPVTPTVPTRPVIRVPASSASEPWVDPTVILKVEADDSTMVVVFLDAECGGVPLVRQPIERLRAGIELDVVHGPNVFSAKAVDGRGIASSCSEPVTVEGRRLSRGTRPAPDVLRTEPPMPSTELTVRLFGRSPAGYRVRVWSQPNCLGKVLASANGFGPTGLPVMLEKDTQMRVSVDGALGLDLTQCSPTLVLENDTIAPEPPALRFFPAAVGPLDDQSIIVTNDSDATDVYDVSENADCPVRQAMPGSPRFCAGLTGSICHRLLYLPVRSDSVSVRRIDRAGNSSCVVTPRPPLLDGGLPELSLAVISGGSSVNVYAATNAPENMVEFFHRSGCGPPALAPDEQPTATQWVKVGQLLGEWSARIAGSSGAGACVDAR